MCVVSIAEAGSKEERNSRNATVTVILCKLKSSHKKELANQYFYCSYI